MAAEIYQLAPPRADHWNQMAGESPSWYACFLSWLMKNPRPDVSHVPEAQRFQWASRAKAYDTNQGALGRPRDLMARTFQALLRLVLIDAEALLTKVLSQPHGTNTLTPGEMVKIFELLASHPELITAGIDSTADVDLSKASPEDLRKLLDAKRILGNLSGR